MPHISPPNSTENTLAFFAYGSLMIPEVITAVIGKYPIGISATLFGYERFFITGEVYPGIFPKNHATTTGMLYFNLSKHQFLMLDTFESPFYDRNTVIVTTGSGTYFSAETYVVQQKNRHRISTESWDIDLFRTTHLSSFLHHISD